MISQLKKKKTAYCIRWWEPTSGAISCYLSWCFTFYTFWSFWLWMRKSHFVRFSLAYLRTCVLSAVTFHTSLSRLKLCRLVQLWWCYFASGSRWPCLSFQLIWKEKRSWFIASGEQWGGKSPKNVEKWRLEEHPEEEFLIIVTNCRCAVIKSKT